MNKHINLMITCVAGSTIPTLVKLLKQSTEFKYRIIGVDCNKLEVNSSNIDVFKLVPPGNHDNYIGSLCNIISDESVDVILPGSDEEAIAMSLEKERIELLGAIPLVSSSECLKLITDKYLTYQKLIENNITVPEFTAVGTIEELHSALDKYQYPYETVIVKPACSRGGRGLHVFIGKKKPPEWLGSGKREVRLEPEHIKQINTKDILDGIMLVMPCLHSPAYDVDVVAAEGNVKSIVVRERINPTGIPFLGNHIKRNRVVEEYCASIAMAVGLDGIHDIDLMTDKSGNVRVLEVNPRPSGSLAASLVAGHKLIDLAICIVLGYKEISDDRPMDNVSVIPMGLDMKLA